MLHAVPWSAFIRLAINTTLLYYVAIGLFFYRKELRAFFKPRDRIVILLLLIGFAAYSQDAKQGLSQANDMIRSYFDVATQLMYAVGAISGLGGAIKVYSRWNEGHQEAWRSASGWLGGCIFLVLAATVIKSVFGI
jgi:hypothetical protein